MSDCSCVYVEVDEYADVIERAMRKARWRHICGECNRYIEKGEQYEYLFSKYDGSMNVDRTCTDCLSVRKEFFCDGYLYGQIWEALIEHIREMDGRISSDCLANLTPRARKQVCKEIEECWEESDEE